MKLKKFISAALASLMLFSAALPAMAADGEAVRSAQALKTLGLFRGSDKGFELDRAPTRMEALIMLIRLTGRENEALSQTRSHPFTDAPTWHNAAEYLGYAYEKGLTTGVSATLFDPETPVSLAECVTFTLRALGYKDEPGLSVWENWEYYSDMIGLVPFEADHSNFTRGDAVRIYYTALDRTVMDDESFRTLNEMLIDEGVYTNDKFNSATRIYGGAVDLKSNMTIIMDAIYAGVENDFGALYQSEINAENAEYFLGTGDLKFVRALASEPMINASAHSVCLVKMDKNADIEAAKQAILDNVDPNKWICVGVDKDKVQVVSRGDLILLVMDNEYGQALVDSFMAVKEK